MEPPALVHISPVTKIMHNPFLQAAETDKESSDEALVVQALAGHSDSLDHLVRRHQAWIFNLAVRMVWRRTVAEDATQEILIKAVTNLGTFQGRSRFRTWLYRIAVNHLINMRKTTEVELKNETFEDFGRVLYEVPDLDLPDPKSVPVEINLLIEEARIGCMTGMLLCLDRRQRVAFILGEVFGVTSDVGGEVMDESAENFRQLLSRARRDLYQFMNDKCGLINQSNPCRCARKTTSYMKAGYVDPNRMQFTENRLAEVREVAADRLDELDALGRKYGELFRGHGFLTPPDLAGKLRGLIGLTDGHGNQANPAMKQIG